MEELFEFLFETIKKNNAFIASSLGQALFSSSLLTEGGLSFLSFICMSP